MKPSTVILPYVYRILDLTNGMQYIGSKTAIKSSINEIGSSYFSSSDLMNDVIRVKGITAFHFEIVKFFKSKQDALDYEQYMLNEVDAMRNPMYYNNSNGGGTSSGLEKNMGNVVDIITKKQIRISNDIISSSPMFCSLSRKFYYISFNNSHYYITNTHLLNHYCDANNLTTGQISRQIDKPPYKAKQSRFAYINGLTVEELSIDMIDSDFILEHHRDFYNPFDIDILDISSAIYEEMDWLSLIKGKRGAFIRSKKGFKQSSHTRELMSRNNGVKGKTACYHKETYEIMYFFENEIPVDYVIGVPPHRRLASSSFTKNKMFYHNPETKEVKRCYPGQQPIGWKLGRIFENRGFNKINDPSKITCFDIISSENKVVDRSELKNPCTLSTNTNKIHKYNLIRFDGYYFVDFDILSQYISHKYVPLSGDWIGGHVKENSIISKITVKSKNQYRIDWLKSFNKETMCDIFELIDLNDFKVEERYNMKIVTKESINGLL